MTILPFEAEERLVILKNHLSKFIEGSEYGYKTRMDFLNQLSESLNIIAITNEWSVKIDTKIKYSPVIVDMGYYKSTDVFTMKVKHEDIRLTRELASLVKRDLLYPNYQEPFDKSKMVFCLYSVAQDICGFYLVGCFLPIYLDCLTQVNRNYKLNQILS